MQMPRNGFDNLAAVARLNTDNTMHHRERWPSLDWVWDELDMLRECWVTAIYAEDYDALETERDAALDELDALTEQRDALSEAVRLLLKPEPDMERVQDILMGGW
jgi:hypothetical protein